ncbi:hypothetical protein PMIN07_008522 [Paraphaeosphaeria minitans]
MVHHVDTSIAFLHRDTSIAFLHRDTSIAFMHHVLARALLNAPSHRLASARSDANVRQRWCFAVAADVIAITPGSLRRFFQNADRSHLHIRLTSASRPILDPLANHHAQCMSSTACRTMGIACRSHSTQECTTMDAYIASLPTRYTPPSSMGGYPLQSRYASDCGAIQAGIRTKAKLTLQRSHVPVPTVQSITQRYGCSI